jgi:Ca2+-binding EF-hand superfamily protein
MEHLSSVNNIIAALNVQDVNGTGIITMHQFDAVFHSCGMDLSPTDTQRFSIRFDLDDKGTVDIERCFSYLRRLSLSTGGQTNSNGKSPEELAVEMCLSKFANKVRGMMEGGSSHDEILRIFALEGKNLALDIGQLQKGCRLIGVELSRELARGLLRKLCLNVRGLVDRTTFLKAVLHAPVPSTTTEEPTIRHINASVADEINRALRLRPDLRSEFIGALLKAQELQGSDLAALERSLKQADTHQLGEVERSNS